MMAEPLPAPTQRPFDSRADALGSGQIVDGKYLIGDPIARGGMGIVLSATHIGLDRPVALKCIRREYASNSTVIERFLNEAQAAARLQNEHVARVLDFGATPSGLPYLVMERLEGADLYAVLAERGPLPATEAADYLLQACEGIAEAHSLGIVHRDLKPENLFLTHGIDGSPVIKILDFGISKQLSTKTERALTNPTTGIGSPCYMSPEQMRRPELVDARSDIWSLGIVLFELITGGVPFEGDSVAAICANVLSAPAPSAAARRAGIPRELDAVIERCLGKIRELRFQNVAELARALAPFASPARRVHVNAIERILGVAETRVTTHARRRMCWGRGLLVAAVASSLAALAVAAASYRQGARPTLGAAADPIEPSVRTVELGPALVLRGARAEREHAIVRARVRPARPPARTASPPSQELPPELLDPPPARDDDATILESAEEVGEPPLPELPPELARDAL